MIIASTYKFLIISNTKRSRLKISRIIHKLVPRLSLYLSKPEFRDNVWKDQFEPYEEKTRKREGSQEKKTSVEGSFSRLRAIQPKGQAAEAGRLSRAGKRRKVPRVRPAAV